MKKLLTLALIGAAALPLSAKPLLVGHRGSDIGVENTVESFTVGAQRGYDYLETDFKVTKDGKFVCTHDDDTQRLGDKNLTIASSTLEELKTVNLTQTRNSVKYTAKLCSAQEYLYVCKEYNVKPLIELKWATGVNSNDQSNIPALIKLVEDNGFRNNCIIMTSMKNCLTYIRTNYPDIELQYLIYGNATNTALEWCTQWGIGIDVQADTDFNNYGPTAVPRYHAVNLPVNVWTVNTNENYLKYGNMGCDFMTTDKLDPKNLPTLTVDDPGYFEIIPNTVDYPDAKGEIKGKYDPELVGEFGIPAAIADMNIRRARMKNNVWYVLAKDPEVAVGGESIVRIDALTGEVLGEMSLKGIDMPLGDIDFTADGYLLACTISLVKDVPTQGEGETFYIYKWDSDEADPEVFVSNNETDPSFGNYYITLGGEAMGVSGNLNDLKVYVATRSNWNDTPGTTWRMQGIIVKNGQWDIQASKYAQSSTYTTTMLTPDMTITVTPTSRDHVIFDSPATQPVEYRFHWDASGIPMDVNDQPATGVVPDKAVGMSYYRRGDKIYALVPGSDANGANFTATLYDVTEGLAKGKPVSGAIHQGLGDKPAPYTTTAFCTAEDGTYLHIFAAEQGFASFKMISEVPEIVYDANFEFTREWIMSNTTDNHPGDIDGTYAQQGTAVDGLFYISNRSEKLIHVFDKDGKVGTIPGVSGFGCTRDDAGNIILRDDTGTGTERKFVVYAAGATPEDYGTPVTFTVNTELNGQCNFISASGDVLGEGGHIYMFPNKQTKVNVINVANGEVTGQEVKTVDIEGSTAGYVVPMNNDPETFIYTVRTLGFKLHDYGILSHAVSSASASTSAPARNSTGGGAYIKLRGHKIVFHNSGANYKGGFTVRDVTDFDHQNVIATVDPVGKLGYEEGGNYSTFNWIITEPVDEGTATVYAYCPANGISCYTLHDKNYVPSGVEGIAIEDKTENSFDETLPSVYYNLNGVRVNADALTPGLYIRRQGSNTAKVVVK
ncbi:MAG: hypothetical protein K2M55_03315 [Muribaculaceae bacterium]|nr:hypothetical protein [Muribaculaceae bacterium]